MHVQAATHRIPRQGNSAKRDRRASWGERARQTRGAAAYVSARERGGSHHGRLFTFFFQALRRSANQETSRIPIHTGVSST